MSRFGSRRNTPDPAPKPESAVSKAESLESGSPSNKGVIPSLSLPEPISIDPPSEDFLSAFSEEPMPSVLDTSLSPVEDLSGYESTPPLPPSPRAAFNKQEDGLRAKVDEEAWKAKQDRLAEQARLAEEARLNELHEIQRELSAAIYDLEHLPEELDSYGQPTPRDSGRRAKLKERIATLNSKRIALGG